VSNSQLVNGSMPSLLSKPSFQEHVRALQYMVIFFQIGTGVTNALIKARQAASKDFAGEVENIPILSTSVAYGVYMAVSSNLR
jgi:hypothetical protein